MLDTLATIATIVSGFAVVIGLAYAAIQIRQNTQAVSSAAFAQVSAAFAEYAFEIARDPDLVALTLRGNSDYSSLGDADRLRFQLSQLSFLRRAENLLFQSNRRHLNDAHWVGVRNSIADVLSSPGARDCWQSIQHRLNPEFGKWVNRLLAQRDGSVD